MNKQVKALQQALEQQRKYERENWPFVGDKNKPTGTGESITYHLASLYCWSPEYVLTLEPEKRLERLKEIWSTFSIAGDIINRYEDATLALLQESEDQGPQPVEKYTCEGCHGSGCKECEYTGHYEYDVYGNYDSAFLDNGSLYAYLDLDNGLVLKEQPEGPVKVSFSAQVTSDLLAFLSQHSDSLGSREQSRE